MCDRRVGVDESPSLAVLFIATIAAVTSIYFHCPCTSSNGIQDKRGDRNISKNFDSEHVAFGSKAEVKSGQKLFGCTISRT